MKFNAAIVRAPSPTFVNGLTSAGLGKPDHEMALQQHRAYVAALRHCGLKVHELPPDDRFPDSTFVEDTAVLAPDLAILMNPGAPSRRGEVEAIAAELKRHIPRIERVQQPGFADGGDVMMVGSHFYIGLSTRTNREGAQQIIDILHAHGLSGSMLDAGEALHLKSECAYIEFNNLVATARMAARREFDGLDKLLVDENEAYAANCLWVNGTVLVAKGYPKLSARIRSLEYSVLELDMSEFQKLDGGLSCLSLRF